MSAPAPPHGIELLARLLAGPTQARRERVAFLGALMAEPASGWTPAQLRTLSPLDEDSTERALGALKRIGVLVWRSERGCYVVPGGHRPALTALYLLDRPTPPAELIAAQAALFGLDDDQERRRPLTGLVELLDEDVRELESAGALGISEQVELAERLERHVGDAERVLGELSTHDAPRGLVERAVALVGRLGAGVADLMERLAHEGADRLPSRAGRSRAELREGVRRLDHGRLCASIEGLVAPAPRARRLPAEETLVHALAQVLRHTSGVRLPEPADVTYRAPQTATPDALGGLRLRLIPQRPATLLDEVAACASWEEAVHVHNGFIRLHERLVSRGAHGMNNTGDLVRDPSPVVGAVSRAIAHTWEGAFADDGSE